MCLQPELLVSQVLGGVCISSSSSPWLLALIPMPHDATQCHMMHGHLHRLQTTCEAPNCLMPSMGMGLVIKECLAISVAVAKFVKMWMMWSGM